MTAQAPRRPILHDYWRSSASYRVRIALNLKGIEFDRVPVDLVAGDHRRREHLEVSRQGLVPAMRIDGLVLTQSLAILEYLEETRPQPALLPADAAARAQVRALSLAVASDIHPMSNLTVLDRVGSLAGAEARAGWNRDNIESGLHAVEAMLDYPAFTGRFCDGDAPTMADCTLFPQLYNAARWGVSISHLPRICAVARACDADPAFAAAHPHHFDPSQEAKVTQGERV